MTTPQPPQQPSQGQGQQALALAAASALAGAATIDAAVSTIMPVATALGIRRRVVEALLGIVMGHPPDAAGFYGPATHNVARINLTRRAMFVAASLFRLTGDDSLMQAGAEAGYWTAALDRERGYYGQQLVAGWNREKAGAQIDTMAMQHGYLLGWYTWLDRRTSPECMVANKHNFWVEEIPWLGYPGMVHPHCRCLAGPPFPGAGILPPATVRPRGRPVSDHRHERRSAAAGQHR